METLNELIQTGSPVIVKAAIIALLAFCMARVVIIFVELNAALYIRHWEKVDGTITDVQTKQIGSSQFCKVVYEYEMGGSTYSKEYQKKVRLEDLLPGKGDKVPLYVDPKGPQRSFEASEVKFVENNKKQPQSLMIISVVLLIAILAVSRYMPKSDVMLLAVLLAGAIVFMKMDKLKRFTTKNLTGEEQQKK